MPQTTQNTRLHIFLLRPCNMGASYKGCCFIRTMKQGKEVPPSSKPGELGKWGEALAARYLVAGGYQVIERNWRAGRAEVDLIAAHRHEMVFIEVKLRAFNGPTSGLDAVTPAKQKRLIQAAHRFLCTRVRTRSPARFDVICIRHGPTGWRLDHWVDAFLPLPSARTWPSPKLKPMR
jgi:putative endonuclease